VHEPRRVACYVAFNAFLSIVVAQHAHCFFSFGLRSNTVRVAATVTCSDHNYDLCVHATASLCCFVYRPD
jgi:hypothetical protein